MSQRRSHAARDGGEDAGVALGVALTMAAVALVAACVPPRVLIRLDAGNVARVEASLAEVLQVELVLV